MAESLYGYCGIPVVRSGDNVFLMNATPLMSWSQEMKDRTERLCLALYAYRCPFDFITEHRQWFEWHKRLHFDKQTTGKIITSMLDDVARINAHKIERELTFRFTGRCDFMPRLSRSVVINATT